MSFGQLGFLGNCCIMHQRPLLWKDTLTFHCIPRTYFFSFFNIFLFHFPFRQYDFKTVTLLAIWKILIISIWHTLLTGLQISNRYSYTFQPITVLSLGDHRGNTRCYFSWHSTEFWKSMALWLLGGSQWENSKSGISRKRLLIVWNASHLWLGVLMTTHLRTGTFHVQLSSFDLLIYFHYITFNKKDLPGNWVLYTSTPPDNKINILHRSLRKNGLPAFTIAQSKPTQ